MYNKHMGGVDHHNKMAILDKSRKAYKWYSRLVRKCNQWSLYNAGVLFKTGNDLPEVSEFRTFVLDALIGLIGDNRFRRNPTSTSSMQPTAASGAGEPGVKRMEGEGGIQNGLTLVEECVEVR